MTSDELLDGHLADWLRSATIDTTAEKLALRRAAVMDLAQQLTDKRSFAVVRAAHGHLDDPSREWISDAIEAADDEFDRSGKDALLKRMAAAAVASALAGPPSDSALLVALLVEASEFVGDQPVVAPLGELARDARLAHVQETRTTDTPPSDALAKWVTDRNKRGTALAEDAGFDPNSVNKALNEIRSTMQLLADRVDKAIQVQHYRGDVVQEELQVLWWSYSRFSETADAPWNEVTATADKVVRAAFELSITCLRAPVPSSGTLLGLVLGDGKQEEVGLAELAVSAQSVVPADLIRCAASPLLPVLTTAGHGLDSGTSDDVWLQTAERASQISVNSMYAAMPAAQQVLRELEIVSLL